MVDCHDVLASVSIVVVDESSGTIFYLKIFIHFQHYFLLMPVGGRLDISCLVIVEFDGKIKQSEILIQKQLPIICVFLHELLRKLFQIILIVLLKFHLSVLFLSLFLVNMSKVRLFFPVKFSSLLLTIHLMMSRWVSIHCFIIYKNEF